MPIGLQGFQKGNSLGVGKKPRLGMGATKGSFKKGQKIAEATRLKMMGRTPWNKDIKMSEEIRHKISESKKGIKLSSEHRKNIGLSHKGKTPKSFTLLKQFQFKKGHKLNVGRHWQQEKTILFGYAKKQERNDSAYFWWHKQCKKRDKNNCKINNRDCSGYCIVHHILPWRDYPELRYNINNGITLCQFHHPRKRAEEQRLIPYFQSLVEVIKN